MHRDTDDTLTIAAVAVLAFIIADVAHEVVGHGIGFFLAGGRSGIFTTTRLVENQRLGYRGGDIFDLGGPAGNLACAGSAWLVQHSLRAAVPRLRLLLWLALAFSLFWAFGYLLFSGIFVKGDWLAMVRGWPRLWIWRTVFVLAGFFLYRLSVGLVSVELAFIDPTKGSIRRLVVTSYLASGVIACAGPILDPRGPLEIFYSGALSSFGAALGLLEVPRFLPRAREGPCRVIGRSYSWILIASLAALVYIFLLGPGVEFRF